MAISLRVLNEATGGSGSVSFDFVYDILADEGVYPVSNENEFYFKMTTSAKQVGSGASIPVKIIKSLSDLTLNGPDDIKQSRSNTLAAYTSITEMVEDYFYDTIYGHIYDQYDTGIAAQGAIDI